MTNVIVNLLANSQGFTKGFGEAEGTLSAFSKKTTQVGQSMMKTGAIMTAGITLPAIAAGKQIFQLGSDMEESVSKVNVVFAEGSKEVQKWASGAAEAMGLSNQKALEAAGTYGNLFQAFGLGRKQSQEMSTTLVQLASDLASFNNTSVDDALLALRSGLSGETEPLKKFGVALSDVRLKEEAVRMGLIKTTKEALTPAAKAQASYALIMKDTTLAQGDYSRTSDGAANTLKTLMAVMQDAGAAIGSMLLPAVTTLASWLKTAATFFNNLSEPIKKAGLLFIVLAAAAGPVITILGTMVTTFGFLLTPIGATVAVIGALTLAFTYLYNSSKPFRKEIDNLISSFKTFVGYGKDVIDMLFKGDFKGGMLGGISEDSEIVDRIFDIRDGAFELLETFKAFAKDTGIIEFFNSLKDTALTLVDPITKIASGLASLNGMSVGEGLGEIVNVLIKVSEDLANVVINIFDKIDWGLVANKLVDGLDKMKDALFAFFGQIDWGAILQTIFKGFTSVFNGLSELLSGIDWGKVVDFIFDALGDAVILLGRTLKNIDWGKTLAALMKGLLAAAKLIFVALPKSIAKLLGAILGKLGSELLQLLPSIEWGELASGIGNGLLDALKAVFVEFPKFLWDIVWGGIKGAFSFLANVEWGEIATMLGEAYLSLLKMVWVELPKKIWELTFNALKGAWDFLKSIDWGDVGSKIVTTYLNLMKWVWTDLLPKVGQTIFNALKGAVQWVVNKGGEILSSLFTFFKELPGKIKDKIGDVGKVLYDKGKAIIQGLLDGAGSLLKKIGEFFLDKVPGWIKGAFKKALGIKSPSKVFAGYGKDILGGLISGLNDSSSVINTVKGLATDVANAFDPEMSNSGFNMEGVAAKRVYVQVNNEVKIEALMPTPELGRLVNDALTEFNYIDAAAL